MICLPASRGSNAEFLPRRPSTRATTPAKAESRYSRVENCLMSVWWFGGAFISAHSHAWRIEQGNRLAIFGVWMIFGMLIAKKPCSNFIYFDETFHAKVSCGFATLVTFHHRHIVAGHQCNGVFRCGFSPARPNNVNLCLGRRPKVVKMDHVRLFGEDIISLTRFTNFMPAPTANGELTQVPTTFQLDGAQVGIQFLKCC